MITWRIILGLVVAGWTAVRAESLTLATYNIENYGPANRMTEVG
jgi:hypothetical protein